MTDSHLYPWQAHIWQQLSQNIARLPHALLLYGHAGIGKYDFARYFSQSLLCLHRDESGRACEQCSSCHWFKEESHPDFKLLTPEQDAETEDEGVSTKKAKKKTQIAVSQIRELSGFLSMSSHRSTGTRIVLIHPAESLNVASANALLKMLEEPAAGVVFILVAHQMHRLLPTIMSRCQKILMPVPQHAQALSWLASHHVANPEMQLAYSDGSPIKVLNEQQQFSQLTEAWRQLALGPKLEPHIAAVTLVAHSAELGLIALQKWLYDILAMRMAQQVRYHLAHVSTLQQLAERVNLSALFQLQKKVDENRQLATHPLNQELQIESLLIEYRKLFVTK